MLTDFQICLNNLASYLKFHFNKCLSRKTWNHFAWAFEPVLQSEHACVTANLSQKGQWFKEKWIYFFFSFFSPFFFSLLFFFWRAVQESSFFCTLSFLALVFLSSNAFMIYVMPLVFIQNGIGCAGPRLRVSEKYMVTCFLHTLFKLKLNPVSSFSGKFLVWVCF